MCPTLRATPYMLLHSAKEAWLDSVCRRSESGRVSDMDELTWNLDGPPAGSWASPTMMGSCTGTGRPTWRAVTGRRDSRGPLPRGSG